MPPINRSQIQLPLNQFISFSSVCSSSMMAVRGVVHIGADHGSRQGNLRSVREHTHVESLRRIRHVRVRAHGSELPRPGAMGPSARFIEPAHQDVHETRAGMTHCCIESSSDEQSTPVVAEAAAGRRCHVDGA
jgi:hypothetical protein